MNCGSDGKDAACLRFGEKTRNFPCVNKKEIEMRTGLIKIFNPSTVIYVFTQAYTHLYIYIYIYVKRVAQ